MPASEYSLDTDRTTDVQTLDVTPFSTIVGDHPKILKGLTDCGFINASPIQVAALPTIIAGNDTIVEAKNGTGKTLTFVVPTLMRLKIEQKHLQSIVLAPTREIAVQIQQCFKKVGQHLPELKCEYFIGGTSIVEDKEKAKNCQIAVGSPGRIKHLLNEHVLKGLEVKSFILDEVDRFFTDTNFTKDVRLIDGKLPKLKQMIVVSASIDKTDMTLFDEFMKEYSVVKGAEEDMNESQDPSKFLLGIKQYVACVKAVSTNIVLLPAKNFRLLNILRNLPYTQCIIFTNYMTRVEAVCNMLRDYKYKADYIRGDQDQNIRLKLVDRLTSFKSQILVATDLIARGIDSSNVDLVINMDCPHDWATYLHRIGRAGRFGNKGNAITILDDDKELNNFKRIINSIENVRIKMLPIAIEKPILEYMDNELEDLNLTVESDVLTNQNENNIKEENGEKSNDQYDVELKPCNSESNVINLSVESETNKKSVYGTGISEEESLVKLREVVMETEKKLIDGNLINKRHLTADRSFVLFDPEPFLDDSDDYMKYSPQELIDIISNYDSDIAKYEAAKKSKPEKIIHQVCLENSSPNQLNDIINLKKNTVTDKESQNHHTFPNESENMSKKVVLSENSIPELFNHTDDVKNIIRNDYQSEKNKTEHSNDSFEVNLEKSISNNSDTAEDTVVKMSPRFTNIYDLFQVPDFSTLKPAEIDNTDVCSTNGHLTDECLLDDDKCEVSSMEDYDLEENSDEEEHSVEEEEHFAEEEDDYCEEEEEDYCEEEEEDYCEEEYCEEEEGESSAEEEDELKEEGKSTNGDFESDYSVFHKDDSLEKFHKKYNNSSPKSIDNSTKVNFTTKHVSIENNDHQLVNYEILNDWYRQWNEQSSFIQKCVWMSK